MSKTSIEELKRTIWTEAQERKIAFDEKRWSELTIRTPISSALMEWRDAVPLLRLLEQISGAELGRMYPLNNTVLTLYDVHIKMP